MPNLAAIVVGPPLGGMLAGVASSQVALVADIAVSAVAPGLSGFRRATMDDA